jgi:hypothetical protein
MSGFDGNPFADPNADPFSDKSVTQARGSRKADAYEDFNPFAKDQFNTATQQPAVLPTSSDVPPPYTMPAPSASAALTAATDDLQRRQEELDRKAAELERRERDMQRNTQGQGIANNFPPLPACCPVKPCFYQDFVIDIPSEFQRIVKIGYYLWIAYSCLLFINVAAALTYFVTSILHNLHNQSGVTFGLSILYFFLFTPCSFVCWYRPLYNAFRSDSSFNFFIFFFIFFCQFCTCIEQCLGIPGSGTVGWLVAFEMMTTDRGVGIFLLVIGCLFTVLAVLCFLLLVRVLRYYRSSGASFKKAQEEFTQGVVTNRAVQQAATGVAVSAASGAASQYGSSSDSRY